MKGDKKVNETNEGNTISDLERRKRALDYLVELLYCRDDFDEIDLNDLISYDGAYPDTGAKTNGKDVQGMLYDVIISGIEIQQDDMEDELYKAEWKKHKAGASRGSRNMKKNKKAQK